MINETRGISEIIKYDLNNIWNLFLINSYSKHNYKFGNDRIGYRDIIINFEHLNNYYSNIKGLM